MVARLGDTVLQNRFLWMMEPGMVFQIAGLLVRAGGEGVHPRYHLVFHQETTVEEVHEILPPLVYPLYSNYHVAWNLVPQHNFFGPFSSIESLFQV